VVEIPQSLFRAAFHALRGVTLLLVLAGSVSPVALAYQGSPGHRQIAIRALDLAIRKGFTEGGLPLEDVRARIEAGAYMEDYAPLPGAVSQYFPDPWTRLPVLDFGGLLPAETVPVGSLSDTVSGWVRGLAHGYDPMQGFRWPGTRWTTLAWCSAAANAFTWQKAVELYRSGQRHEAYECLGHLLHLLSDLSVPAHVAVVNHGTSLVAKKGGHLLDPDLGMLVLDEYESALNGGMSLGGIPLVIPDLLGVFLASLDSARVEGIPVHSRWEEYFAAMALETAAAGETMQFFAPPVSEGNFGRYRNLLGEPVEPSQFAVTPPLSIGGRWTQLSLGTTARIALPPNDTGPILPAPVMRDLARKLVPRAVEYCAGLILAFKAVVGSPTAVREDRSTASTDLLGNYPNPFNPVTLVRFRVPADPVGANGEEAVRLVVVDLLGRVVSTLVSGRMAPGAYEIPFDAAGLAGGVYFCRLTAGSSVVVRKLLLEK
jgi:hypothetical protein